MDDKDLASMGSKIIVDITGFSACPTYHSVALRLHYTADKPICMPRIAILGEAT